LLDNKRRLFILYLDCLCNHGATTVWCLRRRDLTAGEAAILATIQQGYGPQNTAHEVVFTDADEAIILVKGSDGSSSVMANLTNLAAWRADGTISSDEELKTWWLLL
jgi:hypothetical protein